MWFFDIDLHGWKAIFALFAALCFAYGLYIRYERRLPVPPGPRPLPLIGNLLQIPIVESWKVYAKWTEQYGNTIYVEALGQRYIIINSLKDANELLANRAANYSSRLWSPLIAMTRLDWNFGFVDYGQKWRDRRRAFHQLLNQTQVHRYHYLIEQETARSMRRLLSSPQDFLDILKYNFGVSAIRLAYGADPDAVAYNTALTDHAGTLLHNFMEYSAPGRMLVGTFPLMKYIPSWLPGAEWKRLVNHLARISDEVVNRPFDEAIERIRSGKQSDNGSFAADLMGDLSGSPVSEHRRLVARDTAGVCYLAGADTTMSAGRALVLALVMNPDVQRKAQAELDAVVGRHQLPGISDIPQLPYLQAVLKEVARWHTVVPLGLPHVSEQDDVFKEWRIPARTIVYANVWGMMHDPTVYDSPLEFRPEKDGILDPDVLDPLEAAVFGFGRRICPGRYFSRDALSLFAACLIACFDIKPAFDDEGTEIPIHYRVDPGLVSTPSDFVCDITPRSSRHAALILGRMDQ